VEIIVDSEKCSGCGVCAKVCPQMILEVPKRETMRVLEISRCMGCFGCEDECKPGAVRVLRAPLQVNQIEIEPPPMLSECDVAIVGAGPAGLGAAITCAKAGLNTVVFERLPNRTLSHHTDGGVLFTLPWMTSVEVDEHRVAFPELNIAIEAEIAKQCEFLGLLGPDGLSTDNRFPSGVKAWAGDKDKFIHALVDEAESCGARFWFNAKVVDVIRDADQIVGVELSTGESIRAKVTVTADGVFGKISEKAGLPVDKKDLWYATILAYEYDNTMSLSPGLYYLNGGMDSIKGEESIDKLPVAFAALGITEVIHVMVVFLSRKRYYPATMPLDHYVEKLLKNDPRVREKLGDALDGLSPKMLTGCRGVFRGSANTEVVGEGVISIGDAWVDSGEIGNVPALANGVHAARTIIEAFRLKEFSKAALAPAQSFATKKLLGILSKNKEMKLLATRITEEEQRQMYLFMQHMNYPVMLFGSPFQQGKMFFGFILKNLFRFLKYPKVAKLLM